MSSRWHKTEAAFFTILDADPTDRESLIDQHCGDDKEMRENLLALLNAEQQMAGFLEGRAFSDSVAGENAHAERLIGSRIASYEIRRLIGVGGMGVVYEAIDVASAEDVALKLLHVPAGDAQEVQRLWRQEAAMLARVDHPAIARLLDAGATDQGQPYIVMQRVHGAPLDRFEWPAAATHFDRIRVLLQICDAVSHAHQRGVIHRDLKPSNVLVEHNAMGQVPPTVKIVDWGLALAAAPDPRITYTLSLARHGAGTLAYMSPERIREQGRGADVRDDIYSLGAIAYELLTGHRVHDLDGVAYPEAARRICEDDIVRPSRRNRQMRGDIEATLLKALERDPDHRFQSVDALAADLRNCIEGKPIAARRPGLTYDLRRFVSRHKAASIAASVTCLLLIGATIWLGVLYHRAEVAEAEARHRAKVSHDATTLLLWVFTVWAPSQGPPGDVTIHEAMKMLIGELDRLEFDPLIEAEMRHKIAVSLLQRGEREDAERNLNIAHEIVLQHHGPDSFQAANCKIALAQLNFSNDIRAQAEPVADAIKTLRRRADASEEARADLAVALQLLGTIRYYEEKYDESVALYREAVEAMGRTTSQINTGKRITLQTSLARALVAAGKFEEANRIYEKTLNEAKAVLPPDDIRIALLHEHFATRLLRERDYPKAMHHANQALAIVQVRFPEAHERVATAHIARGHIHRAEKRYDEAEADYQRALAIREKLFGPTERSVLSARYAIAKCAEGRGDYDRAIEHFTFVGRHTKKRYPFRKKLIRRVDEALSQVLGKREAAQLAAAAEPNE